MAVNVFRKLLTSTRSAAVSQVFSRSYGIYEPDYLEALKPKYPLYPPLNVQIRGYDFAILEKYQRWVHKVADIMDFDVEDCFAFPPKELKVTKFKPKSTVVDIEYYLRVHERDLKISNIPSVRLPIFIRIVEAALPPGVMLDIDEWSYDKENLRYIPDKTLLDMKQELDSIKKK